VLLVVWCGGIRATVVLVSFLLWRRYFAKMNDDKQKKGRDGCEMSVFEEQQ
jgi:hypothetical protein